MTQGSLSAILLASATMDAFCAYAEFKGPDPERLTLPTGYLPGAPFGFQPGEATDDTQMTVAALHALHTFVTWEDPTGQRNLLDARTVNKLAWATYQEFKAWRDASPPDIGAQTARALRVGGAQGGYAVWKHDRHAAGNGGLMRAHAALLYADSAVQAGRIAAIQTAVTHPDPRTILASFFQAALLSIAATGQGHLHDQIQTALWHTRSAAKELPALMLDSQIYAAKVPAGLWKDALALLNSTIQDAYDYPGTQSGYVLDTLQAALYANLHGDSWGEIAAQIAALGNDADTVGAVAGAIAGARGLTPPDWAEGDLRIGAQWLRWPDRAAPAAQALRDLTARRDQ